MANDLIIHVKTVEGLMQTAMNQLEYIKPKNSPQKDCKTDAIRALKDFQDTELEALIRVCK